MEQLDFGEEGRYVRLDDKKDPLVKLNAIIPWELFRPRLRSVWRLLRSVGIVRARAHIGLKNLAYNMRRLVYLEGAV